MNTAKVSGYGVKVTANDEQMDVKAIAALFAENGQEEHLESFFEEYPEITDFSFLAFSFMELVENEFPELVFTFIGERDENAFVVAIRESAEEIYDATAPANGIVNLDDALVMKNWLADFLPGYKAEWVFEEVSAEFVGIWKDEELY